MCWGAAASGSYTSGQSLGFLLVLDLPLSLGRIYAGSDPLGTTAVLGFYLYLSHVVVLGGYALVQLLDAHGGRLAIAPSDDPDRRPASRDRDSAPAAGSQGGIRGGHSAPESCPAQARLLDRG